MTDNENMPGFPFGTEHIGQIALIVEDLDKAVENYWGLLGIGPWRFYTYAKPFVREMTYRGRPAEYRMRIALSMIGTTHVELIEIIDGPTIYSEFVQQHGCGLHHVGVMVEDLDEAIAKAEAMGFHVIQSGRGYGLDGDGGFAYLDTMEQLGTTFELIEFPKRRAQPEKIFPEVSIP
jgi:catechol 2,3-dioxygenase-like lactoylglutathione lyase family enzyme